MAAASAPSTSVLSDKLEDQAASAALFVARDSSSKHSNSSVLDDDGRLSSASAALSLKYARAQDLPSFPSTGGVKLASASAAASLADSNRKQVELWKPGTIPAANRAANIAKDYEMDPAWKPELSRAGSQAAMIAHRDAPSVEVWKAADTEHGNSAASSALHNQKSPPPITERQVSNDGRHKALLAATMSMSGGRRRAESAPIRPATQAQSTAGWALKAAESSQRKKPAGSPAQTASGLSGLDAARVQNMAKNNVNRQMYTSNPPISIEVEEKKRQDVLRASAVAMAQKMFAIQQSQIDEAKGIRRSDSHYAAFTARRRAQSDAAKLSAVPEPLPRYENLEEAARRLAQERLAKIHDEHAEYRQYYGQQSPPQRPRLTLRRNRRTSSQQDDSDSDEETSRQIRSQMSVFQSKLAEVDSKKRQADRDALLAAAHKNVTAQMNAMDEKVFSETGKTTPQQREIWERQARERAQRESDERMINVGKVHVGGGKYLDQSEIDAIAKARLQPTLDEITEKAEQQRARDEELRLEQERIKAEATAEKQRQAEIKAEQKAAADREKAEAKAQKAEEKRARNEQRTAEKKARDEAIAADKERQRAEKEEKKDSTPGKSRLLPAFFSRGLAAPGVAGAAAITPIGHAGDEPSGTTAADGHASTEDPAGKPTTGRDSHEGVALDEQTAMSPAEAAYVAAAAVDEETPEANKTTDTPAVAERDYAIASSPQEPTSPTSPSKRNSRVKSFFQKFKTGSKTEDDLGEAPTTSLARTGEPIGKLDENAKHGSGSMRDVALAGRGDKEETDDMYGAGSDGRVSPVGNGEIPAAHTTERRSPSISSVATSELSEDPFVIAADVASSRYSGEHGSKRDSAALEQEQVSESEEEPRGRRGFRQRFLNKVIPGKDKDKAKPEASGETPTAGAGVSGTADQPPAADPSHEAQANPDPQILAATEPLREKIQEASPASPDPVPTTAPTLPHTETRGEDDDDFEEARDTFAEQKLSPPPRLVEVSKPETPRLVDVTSPTKRSGASPVDSKTSGGAASRFTEDL